MLQVPPESFPAIFAALLAVAMATLFFCCWRKKEPQEEVTAEKQGVLPAPQNGTVKEGQSSYGSQEGVDDFSAVQRETEILRTYRKPPPPKNRGRQSRAGRAVTRSTENLDIFTEINEDDELNHFADTAAPKTDTAPPVKVIVTDGDKDKKEPVAEAEEDATDVALRDKTADEATTRDARSSMLADIEQTLAAMHRGETQEKGKGEEVTDKEAKDEEVKDEEVKAEDDEEVGKIASSLVASVVEKVKDMNSEATRLEQSVSTKTEDAGEKEMDSTVEDEDKDVDSKDVESKDVESKEEGPGEKVSDDLNVKTPEEDSKTGDVETVKASVTVAKDTTLQVQKEAKKISENLMEGKLTESDDTKEVEKISGIQKEANVDKSDDTSNSSTLAPVEAVEKVGEQVDSAKQECVNLSSDSNSKTQAAVPTESGDSDKSEAVKEDLVQKSTGAISETAAEVSEKLEQSVKVSKATFEISKIPKPQTPEPISVEVSSPPATDLPSPTHKKKGPKVSPKPSRIALAKAGIVLPTHEPGKVQKVAEEEARSSQSSEGASSPSAAPSPETDSLASAKKDSPVLEKKSTDSLPASESAPLSQEAKTVSEGNKKDTSDTSQTAEESAETLPAKSAKESSESSKTEPCGAVAAAECPPGTTSDSVSNPTEAPTSDEPSGPSADETAANDQAPSSPGSPPPDMVPGEGETAARRESEDGSTKGKSSKIPVRAGSKPRSSPPKSPGADKDEPAFK